MKTYYEILGVAPDADRNTVKKAYRKLVKQFHPDVNPEGAKVFGEISRAYNTVIDPEKRKEYDEKLASSAEVKNTVRRKFSFREFKDWLLSFKFVRALFVGKKVAKKKTPAPEAVLDKAYLELDEKDLLQRVIYSTNPHVQINAVRALLAKNKTYVRSDLLRLLYSNIADPVKVAIIEGLSRRMSDKAQSVLREIYDIEKSLQVRRAIRSVCPAV